MALRKAIGTYHDLLTEDLALESWGQLEEQMRNRGLFFGDRPLCTVLRPRFLTLRQYNYLRGQIRPLLGAFDKISRRAVADAEFRSQFGLFEWEEELIQIDAGYDMHTPLTRLDAFFVPSQPELKFTEYNAEVPAASAYNDVLNEVFYGLPVMGAYMKKYVVRPLPTRHSVMHVLLDAYREWGGGLRNHALPSWTGKTCPLAVNLSYSSNISTLRGWPARSSIHGTSRTKMESCTMVIFTSTSFTNGY